MIKTLTSPWMTALIGAIVYLASTVLLWQTPKAPPIAIKAGAMANLIGPSWEFSNPEADQLVSELKAQKLALDEREKELNDMAVRIQAEEAEVNQATQAVRLLQNTFDKEVTRVRADELVNLKKLAKVYAQMDPATAANVLADMDDESVVKIMVFMKDTDTSAILEALARKGEAEAHRTALISDRLRLASNKPQTAK